MAEDYDYVLWIAGRIVRMFQYFKNFVDPRSDEFGSFLKARIEGRLTGNPRTMPYVELYKILKLIINEYAEMKERELGRRCEG